MRTRNCRKRQTIKVAWNNSPTGRVSMAILVQGIEDPRPDQAKKRYWLADFEKTLPFKVRCGAVDVPMQLILKAFGTVPKHLVRRNQREVQRQAKELGKTLLVM